MDFDAPVNVNSIIGHTSTGADDHIVLYVSVTLISFVLFGLCVLLSFTFFLCLCFCMLFFSKFLICVYRGTDKRTK